MLTSAPRCVLRRGSHLVLAGAVLLGLAAGCRPRDELIAAPYRDDFERAELGPTWNNTGAGYRIEQGRLRIKDAYNHPAWLRKRLPRDVVVELDATSYSPAGDLKVELFGDGTSFDPDKGGYTSTGYVLIMGGWHNSLSVLCRNNEHDEGRKAQRIEPRVQLGRTYHWTITRKGGNLDWRVDGQPFLSWTDPDPLQGSGHEYLGINDWQADVAFDNLSIRPAP